MTVKPPKGTRDFYPELMRIQNHIFDGWRSLCLKFGFSEYESPTFESLDLYTQKSGEEIVSQLYAFTDKGDRQMALRPEMTPTLARMINQKGPALKLPIRWFSIPRLYRYEKSQKGRLREFYQLNMDIVGTDSLWAEIELIAAVIEMLQGFGLTSQDFYVGISDRALLGELLRHLGIPDSTQLKVYGVLDKREKLPPDVFKKMLTDINLTAAQLGPIDDFFACDNLAAMEKFCETQGLGGAAESVKSLFQSLENSGYGSFIKMDLSVVRGLAYYTGLVFEVRDRQGQMRAIAGGGRYDNLLKHLGGKDISGVGFGIGDVVLADLLQERGFNPPRTDAPDFYLCTFGEVDSRLFQLARELRSHGFRVTYPLENAKLKKQLTWAEESGATRVLFAGSDKVAPGHYEVKNLATRQQSVQSLKEILAAGPEKRVL